MIIAFLRNSRKGKITGKKAELQLLEGRGKEGEKNELQKARPTLGGVMQLFHIVTAVEVT